MSYAEHVAAATRYAALALTTPPTTAERDQVRVLHDDLAVTLAGITRDVTGLHPVQPQGVSVQDVARHPVRVLQNRLTTLPAASTPSGVAPSERWANRPTSPDDAATAVQVWQGLAVETVLARADLTGHAPRAGDADAWAVLGQVAHLAQALAHTRADLLADDPTRTGRAARAHAVALAVEAREVAHLAGTPPADAGRTWSNRPVRVVVPVTRAGDLPRAVASLVRHVASGRASATDLLAVTRVTAQAATTAATALHTAARTTTGEDAERWRHVATALDAHARTLTQVATTVRANLAPLRGGSPVVLVQAREIAATGLPHLEHQARDHDRSRAVAADALTLAATLPGLTRAVAGALEHTTRAHDVAVRDRDDDAPHPWRPATPPDTAPLTRALTSAAVTLADTIRPALHAPADRGGVDRAPLDRAPVGRPSAERATAKRASPGPAPARASGPTSGTVVDLGAALDRRRAQLFPPPPSPPSLPLPELRVRRRGRSWTWARRWTGAAPSCAPPARPRPSSPRRSSHPTAPTLEGDPRDRDPEPLTGGRWWARPARPRRRPTRLRCSW